MISTAQLSSGAQIRVRGPLTGRVILLLSGGVARDMPGVWSASSEYLIDRLSPKRPDLGFAELRYRIRSWKRHEMCIADGHSAVEWLTQAGARSVSLVGFSLGGAVSTQIADHAQVPTVIGLAPWLPEALPMDRLAGRGFHVLHGTRDPLWGTPGVSPESSRAGFERVLAAGGSGTYTLIDGGIHAIAVRGPFGTRIPMPRARVWASELGRLLSLPEHPAPSP